MDEKQGKFYLRLPFWLAAAAIGLIIALVMVLFTETAEAPGANGNNNGSNNEARLNDEYIGLSEAAAAGLAEEKGHPSRVVHRDGEDLSVTTDFVPNRMNFWIRDGEVFQALTDEQMTRE